MRTTLALLAFAFLPVSAAVAADYGMYPTPYVAAPAPLWTGPYVGIAAGYGWLNDVDNAQVPPFPDFGRGGVYGAYAGYLYQTGSVVLGAELEYLHLGIRFERAPIFIEAQRSISVKARLGVAWGSSLLSVHAGAVHGTTNIGLRGWGSDLGVNFDYALSNNFSLGLQYSHFNFPNFGGTLINARVDSVTTRLSLRF